MCKILIVEDEKNLASFLEKGLRKHGFSTMLATDGEQALQVSKVARYDTILLDLGLPIKDGWIVLQELRDRGDDSPVIVMTAMSDCNQEALAAQANGYLQKPFRLRELISTVKRQTDKRQTNKR